MLKLLMQSALLLLPLAGQAATYTVTSSNGGFSPSNLTINVGDSVTFKNIGGVHNVHATSGPTLFKCANDCASNNAASGGAWSATITFPTAGTVKYQCDPHVSMGMVGSIVVKAVAAPTIALGGYMSGNWYIPNQGGHGYQLEFTNVPGSATGLKMALAIWFVYTPVGTQDSGSGQNWIFAQGDFDPSTNSVTLPAILQDGASFPPNFNSADVQRIPSNDALWGHLTFTFSDCNNGTVSWHSDLPGYNGLNDTAQPIMRLTQIDGTTCPAQ